ncbi:hypothetical protein [Sporichthya polymorpha]|uniref:hypothetical protein n=1 Tax=Sporichthya polymorpha TaxID=35751 RepID=UPI000371C70A|nr:hypothetical protein [Sporichthya polymorpha]
MNTRAQVACAWAGAIGISLTLVALLTADLLPAPAAAWSAEELAAWYTENRNRIRTGAVLGVLSTAGWGALMAVAWMQLKARSATLAALHGIAGAVTYVALILTFTCLGVAAFRPDRAPDTTQALHDLAWFCLLFTVVAPATQAIAAGLAILTGGGAEAGPEFPRWLGYLGCWAGALFVPGILLVFFQDGVFAYQGVIPYLIPLVAFGTWVLGLAWGCRRAALAQ